jgi:endonuclease YncB( thermonuclease family)
MSSDAIDNNLSTLEQKLISMDIKKFSEFDLNGNKIICKVLRVYDTDTITVGFKYSAKFYKKNIRLDGIDAPELHSKVSKESKLCQLGREWISNNYLNKLIVVEMGAMDKYGRIIGTLYDKDTNDIINDKLIEMKFVRKYGGNLHKEPWSDAELNAGLELHTNDVSIINDVIDLNDNRVQSTPKESTIDNIDLNDILEK